MVEDRLINVMTTHILHLFVISIIDPLIPLGRISESGTVARMTINRTTRPDCAVMCNLIITHTHTHLKS